MKYTAILLLAMALGATPSQPLKISVCDFKYQAAFRKNRAAVEIAVKKIGVATTKFKTPCFDVIVSHILNLKKHGKYYMEPRCGTF
jgi:hypothetical protein